METIFEKDAKVSHKQGRYDYLLLDSKKYKLFVAPVLPCECDVICQPFIVQGASICMKKNCDKVHQGVGQKEKVHISSEIFFALKKRCCIY